MSWLTCRRDRRHSQNQKVKELQERSADNIRMLQDLSYLMNHQVEMLEELTDRLEGVLSE